MKFGPLEIVLILIVIIAVVIIARIARPGRIASQKVEESSTEINTDPVQNRAGRRMTLLTRTGIALILAGGIALIAGVSMLQWLLHNYILSFALIACGVVILVLSRRKR